MTETHTLPFNIGNRDFLDAIFTGLDPNEYLWTTQFKHSPATATATQWAGFEVSQYFHNIPPDGLNCYFSVSALTSAGNRARSKKHFSRLFCVVLDDPNALPDIEPTWILETSCPNGRSNCQVGYKLATPLADLDTAIALHKALTAAGHLGIDKNGNNPVRYVRLPVGTNTKPNPPHATRLLHWQPDNTVTLDALINGLGLTLSQPAPALPTAPITDVCTNAAEWTPKARKIAWDSARHTHDNPKLGRHEEIYRMGAYAARDGLPPESLEVMLTEFVRMMRPTDTSGVESGVNWPNERKAIKDGYRQGHIDGVPKPVDASGLLASVQHPTALESVAGMSYADANRRIPEPQLKADAPQTARAFPVHGLDEVAAWIHAGAAVAYPSVTQQAVLTLVSMAVARTYTTPQGDPLSLYLGCCGRSVGELRYAHHAVSNAMAAASLRRMVRATRMTSPATIYKSLLRSPAMLYLSDDYGGVAAFSKRQPSGLQEHALSLISSLYDGKNVQLDGPEEAGFRPGSGNVSDEQPMIYAPSLSILALIGLDQLATLMRQSETGRGALQQMLFAICDERQAIEQDPQSVPPPAWLAQHIRNVRRVAHPELNTDLNLSDIFSQGAGLIPTQTIVPFATSLTPVYAQLDALSSDRRVRSLLLAARGLVRRIAAGLAAWSNPSDPVVTAAILEWTANYVCERMAETVEQFEILHSTDGRSSVYDQVLATVTKAKTQGISNRDLCRECWAYRGLSGEKRAELLELMMADRVLTEVSTVNPQTKRKSKVFVAARFTTLEDDA